MPKNRYDPLLFLPYSLSVACQGKTTPEPSGTRLSFETHRTGEFRKRPRSFKTRNSTHGESTKDPAEKRAKKSAELLSSRIPARWKISRAKAGNSPISFTHRIPKKASSWGPTIARTIRTYIKNMATLLNARRSPTVRLLSGIGSSMSFCQRTEPQKTMTKKTKRTGRLLCQPVYFLMVPKGRLEVFSTIRSYNTLQYNTLTK